MGLGWLLLILSSCGWQLRNAQLLPDAIDRVHLHSERAPLGNELAQAIEAFDVQVVSSAAQAEYSIVIVDFKQSRRVSAVNSNARVAGYQLNERVDFLILDRTGNQLAPLSTASTERSYEFDELNMLASANEEQRVKNSMRAEIVRQLLNHLSGIVKGKGTR